MFKINISEKSGKTFHIESSSEEISGKSLNETIKGEEIYPELKGYELEITGASDKAGLPSMKNVEGVGLKKVLLIYGKAMKKRPKKEGKKKRSKNRPKGLRLRKTIRGKIISPDIIQINMKVLKQGSKKLEEIFPEQCKPKEKENNADKKIVEEVKKEESSD